MSSSDTQQGWKQVAAEARSAIDRLFGDITGVLVTSAVYPGDKLSAAQVHYSETMAAVSQLAALVRQQAAEVARLRLALQNVVVHTARLPSAPVDLLNGLLDSCERIAGAALTPLAAGEAEGA